MRTCLALSLCLLAGPALAFDLNGVRLGGTEADVHRMMPSARCKPLEWKSEAADRRCDDAKASLGGIEARFTAFLKAGAIRALDVRFDVKELERMKAQLRGKWGAPVAETTDVIVRRDKPDRKVFKMRWENGAEHALLTAQLEKKKASLEVSRGDFAEEIYRVR